MKKGDHVCLFFMILVGVFFILFMISPNDDDASRSHSKIENYTLKNAYFSSQTILNRHLKSPETARYPSYSNIRVIQTQAKYIVNAYVDAQNSFGATLRQRYTAQMKRSGNDWLCEYLELNNQVIVCQ